MNDVLFAYPWFTDLPRIIIKAMFVIHGHLSDFNLIITGKSTMLQFKIFLWKFLLKNVFWFLRVTKLLFII